MQFDSVQSLEQTLIEMLSQETDLDIHDIDPKASFAALGLDSVESVSLACRLDDMFSDFTVKPEIFWEVQSISELSEELFRKSRSIIQEA
ncbi:MULTISPECIES: acyl carrier protein [unclassified Novosphingobium]|uniref:acyl carrier protein n=1 Tax=unclassified Novosphingobium TaxID=2644732 RepID=UPI0025EF6D8D|nr:MULTISPECIES: acyl carrier protein [unclassified Novosphingobium]HQV04712.1 acyl carrier protein [Novosphingobium sp.]